MKRTKLIAATQLLGTVAVIAAVAATVETTVPHPDPEAYEPAGPESVAALDAPSPEVLAYAAAAKHALAGRRVADVAAQPGGQVSIVFDDRSSIVVDAVAILPPPRGPGE